MYCLTAWGDVTIWTLNVLSRSEAQSVDMDLGMRLGSCVRLVKVTSGMRLGLAALGPADAGRLMASVSGLLPSSR